MKVLIIVLVGWLTGMQIISLFEAAECAAAVVKERVDVPRYQEEQFAPTYPRGNK